MKPIALVLLCLALGSQGRVLQPSKEALDIPVAIIKEPEPQALPLISAEQEQPIKSEQQQPIKTETEIVPETQTEREAETKTQLPEQQQPELAKAEEAKPELESKPKLESQPELESKPKLESQPELESKPEPELKTELPQIAEKSPSQSESEAEPAQPILKSLPAEAVVEANAEQQVAPVADAVPVEQQAVEQDAVQPHVRQATQATPTQQSTTQQNFVQQLIQNSPIGQFLNQFNGQQQQSSQQVQADQTATPAPTVPGFLNPGAAITSAQNAVQNAAQTVVNSTTQAFQGIQQFASNLGTQFQNTLSGLTGQQNAQPTTARPPGPIQSFVNNVFGGGNNATATAAAPAQGQQGGGPLQGIINFLGGNRPQNAPAAAASAVAAAVTEAPIKQPGVDDKLEQADDVAEQPAESENEVRNSGEAIDDSFEEAVPANEVIVVNDDASADVPASSNNSVEQQPEQQPADAVAL